MANAAVRKSELRYRLYAKIIDAVGSVIQACIPWAGAVLVAYFVYRSIQSLAGRMTLADIGIRFLADTKISEAFAYLFGATGIALGLRRERLHKDNVQRLTSRIKELEVRLDPKRSSSRLTPRGETRPEDKR
jgi:hypothetical protein